MTTPARPDLDALEARAWRADYYMTFDTSALGSTAWQTTWHNAEEDIKALIAYTRHLEAQTSAAWKYTADLETRLRALEAKVTQMQDAVIDTVRADRGFGPEPRRGGRSDCC